MRTTTAMLVAMVVLMMGATGTRAQAAVRPETVIAVHLSDYAQIAPRDLAQAEKLVARVYSAAAIRLVWTDGTSPAMPPADAFRADVVLLSAAMVARKCASEGIGDGALGIATQHGRRAYIFYDRVEAHAARTQADVARLLGFVVAHEVGHLLLPAYSHTPSGIMRASWDGPIVGAPSFSADQGSAMRAILARTAGAN